MTDPPRGFELITRGALTLVQRVDMHGQLLRCGIEEPELLFRQHSGPAHAGRGPVLSIVTWPGATERFVFRKYRRGGLLRFLNADLFYGRRRPFDELAVTLAAAQAGIPVADALAAASLQVWGPLYRHYLVTRELTECLDLPAWLQFGPAGKDAEGLTRSLADLVRRMHDSGLYHADLNLKNILVNRDDARRLFIIDWDKSTHAKGPLSHAARQRNVLRLCRSAAKLRLRGIPVPAQFADIFFEHYWQDPKAAEACRRALRRVLKGREFFWRFIR
jgi:3-deoxy-D-manno-octulosonic acid kinase